MQRDIAVVDAICALERYAKVFCAISDETDARYSATSFVKWMKLEVTGVDRCRNVTTS